MFLLGRFGGVCNFFEGIYSNAYLHDRLIPISPTVFYIPDHCDQLAPRAMDQLQQKFFQYWQPVQDAFEQKPALLPALVAIVAHVAAYNFTSQVLEYRWRVFTRVRVFCVLNFLHIGIFHIGIFHLAIFRIEY